MTQPAIQPELEESSSRLGRWMVVIYNNDTNSVDQVIRILMRATGCSLDEASIETWEAHTYGKAPVHFASREECDRVAAIVSSIGVRTEVSREWED
jgi:ATP-dependent Clp protease adaptor protein ClpS